MRKTMMIIFALILTLGMLVACTSESTSVPIEESASEIQSVDQTFDDGYAYSEVGENIYTIAKDGSFNGYLVVGENKTLAIGITENVTSLNNEYTQGKEVLYVTATDSPEDSYDLGGRTIGVVELSGVEALEGVLLPDGAVEIPDSVAYVDKANGQVFVRECIGDGEAVLTDDEYTTGASYFAMVRFYAEVKKMEKATSGIPEPSVFDGEGNMVETTYLSDMSTLVGKIMNFDDDMIYKYDDSQVTDNYIVEYGTAKLTFHVQTNGYLGYNLVQDSIEDATIGKTEFFAVNYKDLFYLIKDTDLQSMPLIMNDEQALLIDTDYYSGEDFVKQVKELIGSRELHIYITHGHGDHFLNLQYFDANDIGRIYYPANETASTYFSDYDLMDDFKTRFEDKVTYVNDGDRLSVAGKEFEVVQMAGHTDYGTGLLNVTDRILFSGDIVGAQTYKGGTRVAVSKLDVWIGELEKLVARLGIGTSACKIDALNAGHAGTMITPDYILWMQTCVNSYKEKGTDAVLEAITGNLIVTYEGRLITQEELDEVFNSGISDAETYKFCSISILNDLEQE